MGPVYPDAHLNAVTDSPIDVAPSSHSAEVQPVTPPPKRARRIVWPWLILIVAIGAAGLWFWDAQKRLAIAERSSDEWRQIADELRGRQVEVDRELEGLRDQQRSIDNKLSDAASGQRVLREEVLGIGERAALLEDGIARLAQTRQEGAQAMLLDEAEFLLLTGHERLLLFRDAGAAVRAFTLADAALGGLQDPVFAPLRLTLAQEIAALNALPADPLPLARSRINALLAELDTLPSPLQDAAIGADSSSRLLELLGQLITVRRVDEAGAPVDPLLRGAQLTALRLRLQLGLAALERGDAAGWSASLTAINADLTTLFEATDSRVVAHQQALAGLQSPTPSPPASVGATLRELRGLRATRRLGSVQLPLTPAATAGVDSTASPAPSTALPEASVGEAAAAAEQSPDVEQSQDVEPGTAVEPSPMVEVE